MANDTKSTPRIGFASALTLLFIAFKLLGIIDWSWWWVLAPSWIPLAFVLVVLLFAMLIACLPWVSVASIKRIDDRIKRTMAWFSRSK